MTLFQHMKRKRPNKPADSWVYNTGASKVDFEELKKLQQELQLDLAFEENSPQSNQAGSSPYLNDHRKQRINSLTDDLNAECCDAAASETSVFESPLTPNLQQEIIDVLSDYQKLTCNNSNAQSSSGTPATTSRQAARKRKHEMKDVKNVCPPRKTPRRILKRTDQNSQMNADTNSITS